MFSFRTMISPLIIRVAFFVGCAACVVIAAYALAVGVRDRSFTAAAVGIATLIFGPLMLRLAAEAAILFFRMNETLTEIHSLLEAAAGDE